MACAYNIYGAWYVPALPCGGLAGVHIHCVGLVCLLPRTDLVLDWAVICCASCHVSSAYVNHMLSSLLIQATLKLKVLCAKVHGTTPSHTSVVIGTELV